MPSESDLAIKAAINQDWEVAVELNQTILSKNPKDIPTLNRLAFAYCQLGQIQNAKNTYNKVIALDNYNPIAQKNISKLKNVSFTSPANLPPSMVNSFIEEPGKTKTVLLHRPADVQVLATLNPGMVVNLVSKKRRLLIETQDGKYIGCLPDDLGHHLTKLFQAGYTYQTIIKAVESKMVCIFIKETSRGPSSSNLPSFQSSSHSNLHLPQTELLDEIPLDLTPTGEEDESN